MFLYWFSYFSPLACGLLRIHTDKFTSDNGWINTNLDGNYTFRCVWHQTVFCLVHKSVGKVNDLNIQPHAYYFEIFYISSYLLSSHFSICFHPRREWRKYTVCNVERIILNGAPWRNVGKTWYATLVIHGNTPLIIHGNTTLVIHGNTTLVIHGIRRREQHHLKRRAAPWRNVGKTTNCV